MGAYAAGAHTLPFDIVGGSAQHMGLQATGIYTARVKVRLANVAPGLTHYAPFDHIDLQMGRHTSVLVDGWAAQNPASVESHIDSPMLAPGSVLAPARALVGASIGAVELFRVPQPKPGELDFWRDVVPADRLK